MIGKTGRKHAGILQDSEGDDENERETDGEAGVWKMGQNLFHFWKKARLGELWESGSVRWRPLPRF